MGEVGRTPGINNRAGRDHYINGWTIVLAGGGIKGGTVYGATNAERRRRQGQPGQRGRPVRHDLHGPGHQPAGQALCRAAADHRWRPRSPRWSREVPGLMRAADRGGWMDLVSRSCHHA